MIVFSPSLNDRISEAPGWYTGGSCIQNTQTHTNRHTQNTKRRREHVRRTKYTRIYTHRGRRWQSFRRHPWSPHMWDYIVANVELKSRVSMLVTCRSERWTIHFSSRLSSLSPSSPSWVMGSWKIRVLVWRVRRRREKSSERTHDSSPIIQAQTQHHDFISVVDCIYI